MEKNDFNDPEFERLLKGLNHLLETYILSKEYRTDGEHAQYQCEFHEIMVELLIILQCENDFIYEKYDSVFSILQTFREGGYQECERWFTFFNNCICSPTNFAPQYNHLGKGHHANENSNSRI